MRKQPAAVALYHVHKPVYVILSLSQLLHVLVSSAALHFVSFRWMESLSPENLKYAGLSP